MNEKKNYEKCKQTINNRAFRKKSTIRSTQTKKKGAGSGSTIGENKKEETRTKSSNFLKNDDLIKNDLRFILLES